MRCHKLHEGGERRAAKFGGPAKGDFFFAKQLQGKKTCGFMGQVGSVQLGRLKKRGGQLDLNGFHVYTVTHTSQFVI